MSADLSDRTGVGQFAGANAPAHRAHPGTGPRWIGQPRSPPRRGRESAGTASPSVDPGRRCGGCGTTCPPTGPGSSQWSVSARWGLGRRSWCRWRRRRSSTGRSPHGSCRPVRARPLRDQPRRGRGGLDLRPALDRVEGDAGTETRYPDRSLRQAAAAADELPRPMAVGPAAVADHERPGNHPAVPRLRDPVHLHERGADRDHHCDPAPPVLATRPGGARLDRPDHHGLPAQRARVRPTVPEGPGRDRRCRIDGRGGRVRAARDQGLRPCPARLHQVRRPEHAALRDVAGTGPAELEDLDLSRGHPQRDADRCAGPRRCRRRAGQPDSRHPGGLHHLAVVAGLAGRRAGLPDRHGAGGDDRGGPDRGDLRRRERDRRR